MSDVASIVITAFTITIVLQIVLIVLVLDLRKKRKIETPQEKPAVTEQGDFRKQKEWENRFARKTPHEHKTKSAPMQGQNIDQVERSLRDINLRLKNAEKDQEKERRRIKDTLSSPPSRRFDHQKPRERDDHFRRNDRGRQDFQQNRSAESFRNPREEKISSKNNFDTREKKIDLPLQNLAPAAPTAAAPIAAPPEVAAPVAEKNPEPVFETSSAPPETKENLQHGRKFSVKRRVLGLEENQPNEQEKSALNNAGASQPSVASEKQLPEQVQEPKLEVKETNGAEPSQDGNESYAAGPIRFGR
jgi:hypothetical protein